MSTIGIKIADGNYYPIIDTSAVGKKRLVLTTVKDNQESVQVDIYKGEGEDIYSGVYVGSLLLENLEPSVKGEPELELIVGIDDESNVTATVGDNITGERQSLSLSLDTLTEESEFDIPDFDMDSSIEPTSPVTTFEDEDEFDVGDFSPDEYSREEEEAYEEAPPPVASRRASPGLLIVFVLLGLIIIGLLAFLIFRSFQGEETPGLFARLGGSRTEQVVTEDGPPDKTETDAVADDETSEVRDTSDQSSPGEKTVREGRVGGVYYWIKWGDTLWDLSYSFYRTPWLYGKIAGANNIKNPNRIFANTRLFIPEL